MPNIATLLKNEITRIARKEVRAETQSLKKATTVYRGEIAALKRNVRALEQKVRQLSKSEAGKSRSVAPGEEVANTTRFNPKGLASHRRRLDLSAEDYGLLLGASGQSVYKWESGKAKPRGKHLSALAAIRSLGKREAAALLVAMA